MSAGLRIAMWSGPRNISTAMMRAWENRDDCVVSDEPLYAHYLHASGADHPVRDQVIAAGDTDWRRVVAALYGPIPQQRPIWYQKHMCHHLLPGMTLDWIERLSNVLLIRDPRQVIASYLRSRDTVSAEAIGVPQQVALYRHLTGRAAAPPLVIDAGDFLQAPEAYLRALCDHFAIAFSTRMLHWPPGPRDSDGVWAAHWYARVWASSGFEPATLEPAIELPDAAEQVAEECAPLYGLLYARRLQLRAD